MNARQSLDLLNEIERRFPVDRWAVDSIHIWPIVRVRLYFALRDQEVGARVPGQATTAGRIGRLLRESARHLRARIVDRRHNARVSPADAVFLGDQVSRTQVNSLWYDRLCEPIIEHLQGRNLRCLHLERYHQYRVPRNGPSLFIQHALDRGHLRQDLLARLGDARSDSPEGYEDCARFVRDTSGLSLLTAAQIRQNVAHLRADADLFARVLRRTGASLGFVVESYSPTGMAFNLACREQGVRSVEIPHGNHGEVHVAYNRWNRVPPTGYPLLPSVFLCWGNDEVRSIGQWTEPVAAWHAPLEVGNPWMSLWQNPAHPLVVQHDAMVLARKGASPVHVLVTFERDMEDLVRIIKRAPPGWRWWIRLHPTRLHEREAVRQLLRRSAVVRHELDAATDWPLYALLRHMNVHLTECSSVVLEAESFGVPSVITRAFGVEAFGRQVSSGWAVGASSADQVVTAIERFLEQKPSTENSPRALLPSWTGAIDSLLPPPGGRASAHRGQPS